MNDDQLMLKALCQATLLIARGHSLDEVLEAVVESAQRLLRAEFAALGITDDAGRMVTFINRGFSAETLTKLPDLPQGKGLLGAIVREQRSIRLTNLNHDQRSSGVPAHHPHMTSFLGTPLVVEGKSVGNLYLANKVDGGEFSAEDETLLEMLAAHAAIALSKTRLMEEIRERERQRIALYAASQAISSELSLNKVLQTIVDTTRDLVKAQYVALGVPDENGRLDQFIHSGMSPEQVAHISHLPEGKGLLGALLAEPKSIRLDNLASDERSSGFPEGHPAMKSFLGVPLMAGDNMLGNLYLTNKIGAEQFSAEDQALVELLAVKAVIAIQNARLYEQVQQLAVSEERTRIGMDLHDGVIQSIYGVGLILESAQYLAEGNDDLHTILGTAIEGLNGSIRDVRNFIMDLRPRRMHGTLSQALKRLVREFQANALIPTELDNEIENEAAIPQNMARALFLTTQEALANAARHSKATQVWVRVSSSAENLTITIRDNGQGFDMEASNRRVGHGLLNMQQRAANLNGRCTIQSAPNNGTTVTLVLPNLGRQGQ